MDSIKVRCPGFPSPSGVGRWTSSGFRFLRSLIPSRLFDQAADRVSRLRTFADPILNSIILDIDLSRLTRWIVGTEILKVRTISL